MRLSVSHTTHYSYDEPTNYGLQQLRLTPSPRAGLKILEWNLRIEGGRKQVEFLDQHDNLVTLAAMTPESFDIAVQCDGVVETADTHGVIGRHAGRAPLWYFKRSTDRTRPGPRVCALAASLDPSFGADVERLHALSALILERAPYKLGQTHSATSAEEALSGSHGVCQDHTHIFVAAARQLGFPARYVSGYLVMEDRITQEAGHAWAEVHVDALGWVGFDVSNGISPDARYVAVTTGLDAVEAAPVNGLMHERNGRENLNVSLQIQQQ